MLILILPLIITCEAADKPTKDNLSNEPDDLMILDSIISEKLDYGIEVLISIDTIHSILEIDDYFSINKVDKSAIFIGEIKNLESFQNLMFLYFLIIYENSLTTKSLDLSNLSCCYMLIEFMMIFIRQYYELSGYSPTAPLIIDDIYSWISQNKKNISNEIVKKKVMEIENLPE